MKSEIKFVEIATGDYTYRDKDGTTQLSHAVYAICENHKVWKFLPKTGGWIEINKKHEDS